LIAGFSIIINNKKHVKDNDGIVGLPAVILRLDRRIQLMFEEYADDSGFWLSPE
jgi:hypothetical protein